MLTPEEIAPKVAFYTIISLGDEDKARTALEREIVHYQRILDERQQVLTAMLNGEARAMLQSMKPEDIGELAKTAKPDEKMPQVAEPSLKVATTNDPDAPRRRGRPPKNATTQPSTPSTPSQPAPASRPLSTPLRNLETQPVDEE